MSVLKNIMKTRPDFLDVVVDLVNSVDSNNEEAMAHLVDKVLNELTMEDLDMIYNHANVEGKSHMMVMSLLELKRTNPEAYERELIELFEGPAGKKQRKRQLKKQKKHGVPVSK